MMFYPSALEKETDKFQTSTDKISGNWSTEKKNYWDEQVEQEFQQ
jgi:hypothetical protein